MPKHSFFYVLAAGLAVSLLFPSVVSAATSWLPPMMVIAVALFLVAWTMPSRDLWDELRSPWAALWAVAISYGATPLLGWACASLTSDDLGLGIVIIATVPCTVASAVLWTRLAAGREATALLTTFCTTFLGWLVTPLWLVALTGTAVELDVGVMMRDLALALVVPVSLGQLARAVPILRRVAQHHKSLLGMMSQLLILTMILLAAARVGERVQAGQVQVAPVELALAGLLAVAVHLAALSLGWWSGCLLGFSRARRVAVAIAGSQKTLPVAFFLYDAYFQHTVPLAIIPVLSYHVGQLLVDTALAGRLRPPPDPAPPP